MFFFNVIFVTVLALLAGTSMVSASSNDFPIPQEVARHLTNARRLAKGYPLKAPRHYDDHHDHHDHWHRGTRTHEHRAAPSAGPGPSAVQGCIEVIRAYDHTQLGYINKNYNSDGSIGFTDSEAECLRFEFTVDGFLDFLVTINGPDESRPVIGPVPDDDDLFHLTSLADTDMRVLFHPDTQHIDLYRDNKLSGVCDRNNMLLIGDNCQPNESVGLAFVQRT